MGLHGLTLPVVTAQKERHLLSALFRVSGLKTVLEHLAPLQDQRGSHLGQVHILPLDIAAAPTVAHIPDATYTVHVVMYSKDRKMTIWDRADNIQKGTLSPICAPACSASGKVSIHLPTTNLDNEELQTTHRIALKCGSMMTVSHQSFVGIWH